jgi:hypothetical protein
VSSPAQLLYVFWHWRHAAADRAEYERRQLSFHAAYEAHPPGGFVGSSSSVVVGAPWANGGDIAYEDRYALRDASALDTLDQSVAADPHRRAHEGAVQGVAGGTAGLYRVRLGVPVSNPRHALWFGRGEGMTYGALVAVLAPLVRDGESVLWMRRMVLGPTPEFCLESVTPMSLPPPLLPLELELEPIWPLQATETDRARTTRPGAWPR